MDVWQSDEVEEDEGKSVLLAEDWPIGDWNRSEIVDSGESWRSESVAFITILYSGNLGSRTTTLSNILFEKKHLRCQT